MGFNRVARRYYNTVKHAGLNRRAVLLLAFKLLASSNNTHTHNSKVILIKQKIPKEYGWRDQNRSSNSLDLKGLRFFLSRPQSNNIVLHSFCSFFFFIHFI